MPSCFSVPIPFMITCFQIQVLSFYSIECHLLSLDIMLLNILCIVIHQHVLHLSTLPCTFFYIEVLFQWSLATPSYFPNHTCICCLSVFLYVFHQHTVLHSSSVFLHCCPVVSLALTSYSLRPDYMTHKWIKLDVSRTEIRLDPSIYFRMEGIHVNMSCLSILQYLFHL